MGLAYTNYVCVCCEDANVCMPSHVLVGCLLQSRGVFTIGQNIESRGTLCITFLCCVAWRVTYSTARTGPRWWILRF